LAPEEVSIVVNSLIGVEERGGWSCYTCSNFLPLLFQSGECYQWLPFSYTTEKNNSL